MTTKRLNPLFEVNANEQQPQNVISSADVPPLSPFGGKPMVKATCAGVPCWVDLANRLTIPVSVS
jgi:hypothetical protein